MFEVLKNTESTMAELAAAYVTAMKKRESLETTLRQHYEALMDLQKDFLDPDTKESKELKEARLQYENSTLKLDSCLYGLKQIKDRMIEQLPIESQQRREAVSREIKGVRDREKELMKRYLQKIAEAIVIEEEIKGIAVTSFSRSGDLVEAGFRNTNFELLSIEDSAFLRDEVKRLRRPDGQSIQAQISRLGDELSTLEKILEFDDEQKKKYIEQIIAQTLPDTPSVPRAASS